MKAAGSSETSMLAYQTTHHLTPEYHNLKVQLWFSRIHSVIVVYHGTIPLLMQKTYLTVRHVPSVHETENEITFRENSILSLPPRYVSSKCRIFSRYIINRADFHTSTYTNLLCSGMCSSVTDRNWHKSNFWLYRTYEPF